MIKSHSPAIVAGVKAGTGCVNSAIGPVIRIPPLLMAATCSSTLSTMVTSWPARASHAPMVPPIAPAPQTRMRMSFTQLGRLTPGAREQGAGLFDRDLPEREHVFVGPLVEAAVVAVAEVGAQRDRIERAPGREIPHLPLCGGRLHAGEPRPGEVLHPRPVRRDGIDRLHLGPGERRVPPVVEEHAALGVIGAPLLRELLPGADHAKCRV